jgi:hypothetical protein
VQSRTEANLVVLGVTSVASRTLLRTVKISSIKSREY